MREHLVAYIAFNVFHRKRQPALRCAVRQDRRVPTFLQAETWAFGGITTVEEPSPSFEPQAASQATRITGYYLFQAPTS
jgi:hypothetical protein